MFADARSQSPSRARFSVCRLNDENVVKPPQNTDHHELPRGRADQQTPVRLAQRKEEADDQGTRNVYDQGPPRECLADPLRDQPGTHEPQHAADRAADRYPEIGPDQSPLPARARANKKPAWRRVRTHSRRIHGRSHQPMGRLRGTPSPQLSRKDALPRRRRQSAGADTVPAKRAPALSQAADSTPRRCGRACQAPRRICSSSSQRSSASRAWVGPRDDVAEERSVRHRHRPCRMADAQTIPALESAAPVSAFDQRRDQRQSALAGLAGTGAERALAAAAQRGQSGAPRPVQAPEGALRAGQAGAAIRGRPPRHRRQRRDAARPRAGRSRRAPAPAPGRRRHAPARRGRGTAATHPTSCAAFSDALASQPSHSARASAISAQIATGGQVAQAAAHPANGIGNIGAVRVRPAGQGGRALAAPGREAGG